MIARLARFSVRWWWAVILTWAVIAVALWAAAPPFEEVATFDETAFLQPDAAPIKGGRLLAEGWPRDNFTRTAALVLAREDEELTDADRAYAEDVISWLRSDGAPDAFGDVTTHLDDQDLESVLLADDGQAMIVLVGLEVPPFTPPANEAIHDTREYLDDTQHPDGLTVELTGSAAVAADESAAIDRSVNSTHLITIVLVVVILLFVFRSPVAPLVPLATIATAFVVALGTVSLLAEGGMEVSSLYETFSIVIVFGAGTDYCLFLLARYNEELDLGEEHGFEVNGRTRRRTLVVTLFVLIAVLGSSAFTTIAGFTSMSVAEFGMFRTMGPAMAIAVAITLTAALTLAPALMRLFGKWLFWPDLSMAGEHGGDAPLLRTHADRFGFDDPETST
ncbi:MAG: MMPL family transporter [Nitriliruptorales bacterium]|nr:MMPL family transporter [Nitriliruptorales bacterium]